MSPEDKLLSQWLDGLKGREDLLVGPGDDCAVVRDGRRIGLLKTDCIVENVHFLRGHDPERVARKALCRPLSDIAAMGGVPDFALITILTPPELNPGYWSDFYRGLRRAAAGFGVTIAGGELSRQPGGIAVSVAMTGSMRGAKPVLRSGGSPGDMLFVTGVLGGSLGGHHLDFVPRLAEGQWLAGRGIASAMMDLSDGLASDLPRLARASRCGFRVGEVPARSGVSREAALSDGEDYELLFAAPPLLARRLSQWPFPKTPLTCIGELAKPGVEPQDWPGGWDHFSVAPRPSARQLTDVQPAPRRRTKPRPA